MKIGIDIDETLVDTEKSFDEIIKKYNLDIRCQYMDIWKKEEFKKLYPYFSELLGSAKLKDGAKKAVDILNKKHELYIITARSNKYSSEIERVTLDLIKNNGLEFKKVYFNQAKKSDLARKLGLDLMIDDSLNVYDNMLRENIDCILFGDNIKTWDEVLKYITEKGELDE